MKLAPDQLLKMEQWTMVMALMGFDRDRLDDDYYEENGGVIETLETLESIEERKHVEGDPIHAAYRTQEMNITSGEITDYHDYLDALAEEQRKIDAALRVQNNPALIKLRAQHEFAFITDSKQYPKHLHFRFKMPGGIKVRGRMFRHSWHQTRLWLYWTDNLGNKHQNLTMVDNGGHDISWPAVFPREWHNSYGKSMDHVALIIAWKQIHNSKLPTGMDRIKRAQKSVVKTQQPTVDQ